MRLPRLAEKFVRKEMRRRGAEKYLRFFHRGDFAKHLSVKALADVAVDTPVFNHHTSALDILWASVPLLTMPMETMSSRVAASIVAAMGLEELVGGREEGLMAQIARDLRDYEALLSLLVGRTGKLDRLRERMMESEGGGAAFDTYGIVDRFEKAIMMMYDMMSTERYAMKVHDGVNK